LADGELIVHWDDDDRQAPHRLSYQARAMSDGRASLCGSNRVLYFDAASGRAWLYAYSSGARSWVAGSSLCYRRSLWQANPFAPVAVREDTRFVWSAAAQRPIVLDDHRFFVAMIHPQNSNRKTTDGVCWSPVPINEVRSLLGSDWEHYQRDGVSATASMQAPGHA
jgi:hypothetical protein